MADEPEGSDEALREALAAVDEARRQLGRAAEILRGNRVDPSLRAMRAEQQISRAMGALWGVELP